MKYSFVRVSLGLSVELFVSFGLASFEKENPVWVLFGLPFLPLVCHFERS